MATPPNETTTAVATTSLMEPRSDAAKRVLATLPPEALAMVQKVATERNMVLAAMHQIMTSDIHYGKIPNTGDKPTLLKPGAEVLTQMFGLLPTFESTEMIEEGDHRTYRVKCFMRRGTEVVGEGPGICSTKEKKYRWRRADLKCPLPSCGKETIKRSKFDDKGWYCFSKIGGCGAKFPAEDPRIANQDVGQKENEDLADVWNTVEKMAYKRAFVAAALMGTAASELFTQDVEDMPAAGPTEMRNVTPDGEEDGGDQEQAAQAAAPGQGPPAQRPPAQRRRQQQRPAAAGAQPGSAAAAPQQPPSAQQPAATDLPDDDPITQLPPGEPWKLPRGSSPETNDLGMLVRITEQPKRQDRVWIRVGGRDETCMIEKVIGPLERHGIKYWVCVPLVAQRTAEEVQSEGRAVAAGTVEADAQTAELDAAASHGFNPDSQPDRADFDGHQGETPGDWNENPDPAWNQTERPEQPAAATPQQPEPPPPTPQPPGQDPDWVHDSTQDANPGQRVPLKDVPARPYPFSEQHDSNVIAKPDGSKRKFGAVTEEQVMVGDELSKVSADGKLWPEVVVQVLREVTWSGKRTWICVTDPRPKRPKDDQAQPEGNGA